MLFTGKEIGVCRQRSQCTAESVSLSEGHVRLQPVGSDKNMVDSARCSLGFL